MLAEIGRTYKSGVRLVWFLAAIPPFQPSAKLSSMPFSVRGFNQILEDIQAARAWYTSIGIPTDGTRLELIEERVAALLADLKSERAEKVVERWSRAETYYVLSDGAAFGRIAREISKVGPNLMPKRSLRVLLEGPLNPQDEIPGDESVNARNIFTELELAAYFSEKGIPPTGFGDLSFRFREVNYSLQSKRLLSTSRVQENIQKAYDQLKGNLTTDDDRGLIALAVDKVMGLEGKIYRVDNDIDVTSEVYRFTDEFKRTFGPAWTGFIDTRVIGILVVFRFLCHTAKLNVIGPAYYVDVLPLVSEHTLQASDLLRLREVVSHLSGSPTRER
jgi:hypothetical protein